MSTRRDAIRGLAAGAVSLAAARTMAQDDRSPITVLCGAATTMDATARIFADHLKDALNRPVVVLSKLGAGGRIAMGELRRAAPDGRTLMVSASSPFTIYPNIYTRLEYDPVADFTPISGLTWFDVALATGPATQATDLKQLLAWARGRPELIYGAAPGSGSSSHFAGMAVGLAAGVKTTLVPYKEAAPGIGDTVTGRLPLMITGTGTLAEMHKSGKLRIVATSGEERSPLTPEVPTLKEGGIAVSILNSAGLYGPPGMSRELVVRLNAALEPVFKRPDLAERLLVQGMVPQYATPQQLAASLADDRRRYAELVRRGGYVPEAS